jgi:MFS family permease
MPAEPDGLDPAGTAQGGTGLTLRSAAVRLAPDLGPIRHSREYRLLFSGQTASYFGLAFSYVALPYQAYQLSRSSLVVGLLSVTELIPLVLAGLAGGLLADAVERRRLILATQCVVGAAAAVLLLNSLLWHQLWALFALSAVLAAAAGLHRPSLEVLVPVLVPRDALPAAAALAGVMGTVSQTGGPVLAGLAIAAGGAPAGYGAAAAACLAALIPFSLLRPRPATAGADRPSLGTLAEGLRYARSRPELLGSYLIDIGALLFGAPYAVFPQIAARLGGPAVLGLLYAAPGFGSALVSVTSRWTRRVRRHGRAIALAVCGWGAGITGFGFAPNLPLAVLALAAAGGSDMVSGLFRLTMWNQTIPHRIRGRLAGLELISYSAGEPLGNVEAGAVATLTGSVRIAVVSGGVLSVLGAVLVCLALPALWRYDAAAARDAGEPSPASA